MKRRVLITNDDGITAPGLLALVESLYSTGEFDIRVVAPLYEQTGVGHGLTLFRPLKARLEKLSLSGASFDGYAVDGTPADCVKLAIRNLFADFQPELVLSGINRGSNVGTSILYSGTVAGALEAVLNGVPAFALSMEYPSGGVWQYSEASDLAVKLARRFFMVGLPPLTALNVNFPSCSLREAKGIRGTSIGISGYCEGYREANSGEESIRTFHIEGEFVVRDTSDEYDGAALRDGWITCSFIGPSRGATNIDHSSSLSELFEPLLGAVIDGQKEG